MREYLILHMTALAAGIVLDVLIGDPHALPHPVRAIGTLVAWLEGLLRGDSAGTDIERSGQKRETVCGVLLWIAVVFVTVLVSAGILAGSYWLDRYFGLAVEAVLTFYVLAAGSLRDESMKVYKALTDSKKMDQGVGGPGPLWRARQCLSMIVGRDTQCLDEAGIIRATVETVAENTSDGVIAPLLYVFCGGPVLGFCYKAVNTMDSMLGYHNDRYEYFGKMAAKADDVANFIPSRICAVLMIASSAVMGAFQRLFCKAGEFRYDFREAARIWIRDRHKHRSPNSAQTVSVCAGALAVRLGGDSSYNGVLVSKPFIGDDTRPVEAGDIKRAIGLMFTAEALCTAVIFIITGSVMIFRLI